MQIHFKAYPPGRHLDGQGASQSRNSYMILCKCNRHASCWIYG